MSFEVILVLLLLNLYNMRGTSTLLLYRLFIRDYLIALFLQYSGGDVRHGPKFPSSMLRLVLLVLLPRLSN
jgi:hypothetical protein